MNDAPDRLVTAKRAEEDAAELALRPQTLDDFIGQKQVRENLKIIPATSEHYKDFLKKFVTQEAQIPSISHGIPSNFSG
jgi:Holliday junction DNA helicase RuvB